MARQLPPTMQEVQPPPIMQEKSSTRLEVHPSPSLPSLDSVHQPAPSQEIQVFADRQPATFQDFLAQLPTSQEVRRVIHEQGPVAQDTLVVYQPPLLDSTPSFHHPTSSIQEFRRVVYEPRSSVRDIRVVCEPSPTLAPESLPTLHQPTPSIEEIRRIAHEPGPLAKDAWVSSVDISVAHQSPPPIQEVKRILHEPEPLAHRIHVVHEAPIVHDIPVEHHQPLGRVDSGPVAQVRHPSPIRETFHCCTSQDLSSKRSGG